jgi:excinuclease ABC subunit B
MPEVSLVAILDADKEGFLRSEGSLIQTIGRAARNVHGKAILYADVETGSMRRAIDETNRRRARQIAYNLEHGITPQTIIKRVADVMEGAREEGAKSRGDKSRRKVAEPRLAYERLTPEQLARRLHKLEAEMFRHARELEFERAAELRDEIERLRHEGLGLPEDLAG